MKNKIVLTLSMVLAFNLSNAQSVTKTIDTMSDKIYWIADNSPIYSENGSDGFITSASFKYNVDEMVFTGINLIIFGLECLEEVELIILFEDETKIKLISWNDFNCDGNAWYHFNKKDIQKISTTKIIKIKVQNGRNYKSYTFESPDPSYFIKIADNAKNNIYTEKKE